MFDQEPEDPHGECRHEIHRLQAELAAERERADDLDSDNRELVRQRREANDRAYGAESEAERLQLALATAIERAERAEAAFEACEPCVVQPERKCEPIGRIVVDACRKSEARAKAAEAEQTALQFSMDKCSRELAATEDQLERVNGEVKRLRTERDAAMAPTAEAVEKDVCALLDLYHDREQQALAEVRRLRERLTASREMVSGLADNAGKLNDRITKALSILDVPRTLVDYDLVRGAIAALKGES